MSILNEVERYLPEEDLNEALFNMEPVGDKYKITRGGKTVCTVEFINNETDESDDMEDAQETPDNYTVYMTDIKDEMAADDYKDKLEDMGFDRVSM